MLTLATFPPGPPARAVPPEFLPEDDDAAPAAILWEPSWRTLDDAGRDLVRQDTPRADILVSRWNDPCSTARRAQAVAPAGRCVIGVALRPTRIRLVSGAVQLFEGTMPAGMMHVAGPGQILDAEFFSPCDFIHIHVAVSYLRMQQVVAEAGPADPMLVLTNLLVRDDLAVQLVRSLTESANAGDPLYVQSIGQMIIMRLLRLRPAVPKVNALPKWRLRRVMEHVEANMAEPVTLAGLAQAAGLSRMHFAAQFRAATGCKPHEYLLQHRIECAKEALAASSMPLVEVAFSVGFQTQSHFSTVFKRLVGETPGRWQRANARR